MSWNISQLNDFMGEWAMHNVTWDYQDPAPQSTAGSNQGALYRSKYGLVTDTSKNDRTAAPDQGRAARHDYASHRRFISPFHWAPQRFGYNVIRLYPDAGATSVTVTFRGVTSAPPSPDWRWGLVATDSGITTPATAPCRRARTPSSLSASTPVRRSSWWSSAPRRPGTTSSGTRRTARCRAIPYMVQLAGPGPTAFQGGSRTPVRRARLRVSNGGGCGPSGLPRPCTSGRMPW